MSSSWKPMLNAYWRDENASVGNTFLTREQVVAHCLVRWAENMNLMPCPIVEDCEGCNIDFGIWWDWHNSLSHKTRMAVQGVMIKCGIPLPKGPWEEVPTNAVPTALD